MNITQKIAKAKAEGKMNIVRILEKQLAISRRVNEIEGMSAEERIQLVSAI